MRQDWGNWNWFTALALFLVGLPVLAVLFGTMLRFTGLRRASRACLYGGLGGYIGAATATFTSIGTAFFTYIFHLWRFPDKGVSPSRILSISIAAVLIVIPIAGLLSGALYGLWRARRAKVSET